MNRKRNQEKSEISQVFGLLYQEFLYPKIKGDHKRLFLLLENLDEVIKKIKKKDSSFDFLPLIESLGNFPRIDAPQNFHAKVVNILNKFKGFHEKYLEKQLCISIVNNIILESNQQKLSLIIENENAITFLGSSNQMIYEKIFEHLLFSEIPSYINSLNEQNSYDISYGNLLLKYFSIFTDKVKFDFKSITLIEICLEEYILLLLYNLKILENKKFNKDLKENILIQSKKILEQYLTLFSRFKIIDKKYFIFFILISVIIKKSLSIEDFSFLKTKNDFIYWMNFFQELIDFFKIFKVYILDEISKKNVLEKKLCFMSRGIFHNISLKNITISKIEITIIFLSYFEKIFKFILQLNIYGIQQLLDENKFFIARGFINSLLNKLYLFYIDKNNYIESQKKIILKEIFENIQKGEIEEKFFKNLKTEEQYELQLNNILGDFLFIYKKNILEFFLYFSDKFKENFCEEWGIIFKFLGDLKFKNIILEKNDNSKNTESKLIKYKKNEFYLTSSNYCSVAQKIKNQKETYFDKENINYFERLIKITFSTVRKKYNYSEKKLVTFCNLNWLSEDEEVNLEKLNVICSNIINFKKNFYSLFSLICSSHNEKMLDKFFSFAFDSKEMKEDLKKLLLSKEFFNVEQSIIIRNQIVSNINKINNEEFFLSFLPKVFLKFENDDNFFSFIQRIFYFCQEKDMLKGIRLIYNNLIKIFESISKPNFKIKLNSFKTILFFIKVNSDYSISLGKNCNNNYQLTYNFYTKYKKSNGFFFDINSIVANTFAFINDNIKEKEIIKDLLFCLKDKIKDIYFANTIKFETFCEFLEGFITKNEVFEYENEDVVYLVLQIIFYSLYHYRKFNQEDLKNLDYYKKIIDKFFEKVMKFISSIRTNDDKALSIYSSYILKLLEIYNIFFLFMKNSKEPQVVIVEFLNSKLFKTIQIIPTNFPVAIKIFRFIFFHFLETQFKYNPVLYFLFCLFLYGENHHYEFFKEFFNLNQFNLINYPSNKNCLCDKKKEILKLLSEKLLIFFMSKVQCNTKEKNGKKCFKTTYNKKEIFLPDFFETLTCISNFLNKEHENIVSHPLTTKYFILEKVSNDEKGEKMTFVKDEFLKEILEGLSMSSLAKLNNKEFMYLDEPNKNYNNLIDLKNKLDDYSIFQKLNCNIFYLENTNEENNKFNNFFKLLGNEVNEISYKNSNPNPHKTERKLSFMNNIITFRLFEVNQRNEYDDCSDISIIWGKINEKDVSEYIKSKYKIIISPLSNDDYQINIYQKDQKMVKHEYALTIFDEQDYQFLSDLIIKNIIFLSLFDSITTQESIDLSKQSYYFIIKERENIIKEIKKYFQKKSDSNILLNEIKNINTNK